MARPVHERQPHARRSATTASGRSTTTPAATRWPRCTSPTTPSRPYEVWTGPQVAWQLARGQPQAYGRKANAAVRAVADVRALPGRADRLAPAALDAHARPGVVLSFVASLCEFNQGDVFWSTPLIYPPMIYLAARMVVDRLAHRPRARSTSASATCSSWSGSIFALMGFRLGLNNQDSNVIDVGYAGVAGASRLMDGVLPYGHMPDSDRQAVRRPLLQRRPGRLHPDRRPLRVADRERRHLRADGVPRLRPGGARRWAGAGSGTRLPAAHVAASAFDILAVVGLFVAGWRLASRRARGGARVRLGGEPVHALLAEHELQRRARRRAPGVDARAAVASRPPAARSWPRPALTKFAPARHRAAVRVAAQPRGDDRRLRRRGARPALDARARRGRRLALLAPHDRLPARPGDADVDLDARHLPPGLVGPAAGSSTSLQIAAASASSRSRCSRGGARTRPRWPRSPAPS